MKPRKPYHNNYSKNSVLGKDYYHGKTEDNEDLYLEGRLRVPHRG